MKTFSTPINALLQQTPPRKDAAFSDLAIRKPKVRFADLEGGLLEDNEDDGMPPKRYRLTPAVPTREASLMMPDRVHSPIRTPTFPADKSKTMKMVMVNEPSTSMSEMSQSVSQVPADLTPWSMGFRSNVSTNMGLGDVSRECEDDGMMEVTESTRTESDYLPKLLEEDDEMDVSEPAIQVDDTYLTKLLEDDGREMAEPIQGENAYMVKLREYRRCMLDLVKKKAEQRNTIQQVEEAVRGKMTLLDKSMRKVDGEIKAALERLRSVKFTR